MRTTILVAALAAMFTPSLPATAATIPVTAENFAASFHAALPGDRLVVTGVIPGMTLIGKSWTVPVVIDARRATFPDTMLFKRIGGLTIIGGRFGSATTGTRITRALIIDDSERIRVTSPQVVGIASDSGIHISDTVNATVSGGTFTGLRRGLAFVNVTGGVISNNRFIDASSDGIAIVDSRNVLARNNSCTDFNPTPGAHPDCLQMWTTPGLPIQSDITVADNFASGATQGFTLFNGGGLRINIVRNRVDTSFPQGIACYDCVDSLIADNVLTTRPGALYVTRINVIRGSNNTVRDNMIAPKP